ncbi:MAG: DNA polymerase IV [Nanoarchaeota archaeon]
MTGTPHLIAHVDMDCFFCACEVKRNPQLAGKPLIVGATGIRGVVSTASYEARSYGVHSAMPISKARRLCPDGIFLPVDGRHYRRQSRLIMDVLSEFADDMEQVSIDEAYLDITSFASHFSSPARAAVFIQKVVEKRLRLSCSIGISCSRIVSKIASDFRKPAGVTYVEDARGFLAPMSISTFPGIGAVSAQHYKDNGIYHIGDLADKDRFFILDTFGMSGIRFQDVALGNDRSGLTHRTHAKSISREQTFPKDQLDFHLLAERIEKLCDQVHDDLDSACCKTVSIKVRLSDFTTLTRDKTLRVATNSHQTIRDCALHLLRHSITAGEEVRLIGVRLSNLAFGNDRQATLGVFC